MAIKVEENINPEIFLEDPKDILEEPPPRPEILRDKEDKMREKRETSKKN